MAIEWDELGAAIGASVDDPGSIPHTGKAFVAYAGGKREAVKQLSGLSGRPQRGDYATPDEYKSDLRKWSTAERRVQRYTTTSGAERRGAQRVPLTAEQRERVSSAAVDRKWAALVRNGARMRVRATVKVPTPKPGKVADVRTRDMPSGPAVRIPADQVADFLGELEDDPERAAADLLEDFFESYGFEGAELVGVEWVKVWPDGEAEPA